MSPPRPYKTQAGVDGGRKKTRDGEWTITTLVIALLQFSFITFLGGDGERKKSRNEEVENRSGRGAVTAVKWD